MPLSSRTKEYAKQETKQMMGFLHLSNPRDLILLIYLWTPIAQETDNREFMAFYQNHTPHMINTKVNI
jgi:hypothetical protein